MTLIFPTVAEQVVAEFESATKTVSLVALATKRLDAERRTIYQSGRVIEFTFDDDSTLEIRGQGKSHHYVTRLP